MRCVTGKRTTQARKRPSMRTNIIHLSLLCLKGNTKMEWRPRKRMSWYFPVLIELLGLATNCSSKLPYQTFVVLSMNCRWRTKENKLICRIPGQDGDITPPPAYYLNSKKFVDVVRRAYNVFRNIWHGTPCGCLDTLQSISSNRKLDALTKEMTHAMISTDQFMHMNWTVRRTAKDMVWHLS